MKMWRNREFRTFLLILFAFVVVAIGAFIVLFQNYTIKLNTLHIHQNIATVGSLAKQYPEKETEIIKNFIKMDSADYQYGKDLAEKYSYSEALKAEANSSLGAVVKEYQVYFILLIIIICGILFTLYCAFSKGIYKKVDSITSSTECILEGNYKPLEGDKNEGDISLLIHQINVLAERMNENVMTLKEEKGLLKKLTTDISHQLKTPLASLIMFNDLLLSDKSMSMEQREQFLTESKNQLNRIEWLIINLLKMSKLDAKVVEFEKVHSDIFTTINRSISGLTLYAKEKNVQIMSEGIMHISINHDVNWTCEAISNIIKNCIEHSYNDSKIVISAEENSVFVQISIKDFGAGITKQELPRIFDRFYKGSNSNNPLNIGVGLYIAKAIIEGQGGTIYVNSTVGQGTEFTLRFMKVL